MSIGGGGTYLFFPPFQADVDKASHPIANPESLFASVDHIMHWDFHSCSEIGLGLVERRPKDINNNDSGLLLMMFTLISIPLVQVDEI